MLGDELREGLFTRREWLALTAGFVAQSGALASLRTVNTVTGAVTLAQLGRTLMHEHLLIDFIGAEKLTPGRYDRDEAFEVIRPYLEEAYKAGVRTLVEATPEHLGRDVVLFQRLSQVTGVHIVTSTGIYGARGEKYIPDYARHETAEQLAERYEREIEHGIGATGIRPGIIKLAVKPGPGALPELHHKLVRAAALAHNRTGLLVEGHTDQGHTAIEEIEIFAEAKAPAHAFVWVHAHQEQDHSFHLKAARAGAWVEFDGIRKGHLYIRAWNDLDWHVECLRTLKEANLLRRALISQDAGWYNVGDPRGGPFHGFVYLFQDFIPKLKAAGFSGAEIDQLLIHNPAAALSGG